MSLSADLAKFAARNKAKLLKVAQNSLMRVGGSIVLKSPVKDGFFKNGWLSAYGAADTTIHGAADISGGKSMEMLKVKINGLDIGQVFYFTNPYPYGPRLEYDSWSQQAPAGMVRLSVANWQSIVAEEVARVK